MGDQLLTQKELMAMIQKAVVTTADGGIQPPAAVDEFVTFAIEQNQILQEFRVEQNIVKSLEINAIDLGDPVLVKAVEGQKPSDDDVTKPSMPKVTLTPVESLAAFDLTYSWLRKNVRRESANEDINREYAKRIGKDTVLVTFNGDTGNSGNTRKDKALQIMDGLLKKFENDADVHDYTIPADPTYKGAGGVFSTMMSQLDKDLRDQRDQLIFLVGTDVFDAYADEIGALETALGSQVLVQGEYQGGLKYKGIKIMPVYGFPSNTVVLTLKPNIVIGYGQDMELYQQNQHRKRVLEVTITIEFDADYFLGDAVVYGKQA